MDKFWVNNELCLVEFENFYYYSPLFKTINKRVLFLFEKMMSNNSHKISKPLTRPSSGQSKKPSTTTIQSKMEVLPPEKTSGPDFSKPQFQTKKGNWPFLNLHLMSKDNKLERIGSASKSSNTSIRSSKDITGLDSSRNDNLFASNGFNQSARSDIHDPAGLFKSKLKN